MLERLEGADRAAELLALLDVEEGVVEGALGDAEHRRGEDQALDVEARHQLRPALVDLAEDGVRRSGAVGEVEVVGLAAAHRLDRDRPPSLRLRCGTQIIVRPSCLLSPLVVRQTTRTWSEMWALEKKTFWPLMTKPPSTALGGAGERADVGAGLRLGHRDRLDRAGGDPAEDLLLLLLGAEALGGAGDDQRRRVAADRGQAARGLLHEEAGVEHRAAGAAVLLGDRDPEPAELRHLLVDVEVVVLAVAVGEPLALVLRAALALAEVADRVDEVLLLVGEGEVHGGSL